MTVLSEMATSRLTEHNLAAFADDDRRSVTIDSYDRCAEIYVERLSHADLRPYLLRFRARLGPGAVVLDGGCGGGRDMSWMTDNDLIPVGLDLSAGMLAHARRAVPTATFLHADLRAVPLPDNAVDGAWLSASLLHLAPSEAQEAFREMYRVLRPGGIMFISTAFGRGSQWRATDVGRRWFQLYDESDLNTMVGQAGLRTVDSVTEPGVVQGRWINLTAEKGVSCTS